MDMWKALRWFGRQDRELYHSHVFLSYRHCNSSVAREITYTMQGFGLRVWMDRDEGEHDPSPRPAGDLRGSRIPDKDLPGTLRSAIESSILAAIVISPEIADSGWVPWEIEIARCSGKPLFFWHLVDPGAAVKVAARLSGPPYLGLAMLETALRSYRGEFLASDESVEFMRELATKQDLSILGHGIGSREDIGRLCSELNVLIEMTELALHKGRRPDPETLLGLWPEYGELLTRASKLSQEILQRFGRRVGVSRVPVGHGFRLGRPFVLTRIRYLEKMLKSHSFREKEFRKLAQG